MVGCICARMCWYENCRTQLTLRVSDCMENCAASLCCQNMFHHFGRKSDNELIWRNSNLRQYPNRRSSWTHTIDTHTVHSHFSIGSILTSAPYLLCDAVDGWAVCLRYRQQMWIYAIKLFDLGVYGESKIVLYTRARKTQIVRRRHPTKARYELISHIARRVPTNLLLHVRMHTVE